MISIDPRVIQQLASEGRRIDGRDSMEYRKIDLETGYIKMAEGSARVRLGRTEVVAGVKMDVGDPYSDRPDEGVIIVSSEFVPVAGPEIESGPPGEDAIEVSRVVDRAIRESKVIDFKKLVIEEGEKVWLAFVDIDVLDDDGNLIDASSLAAIAALMTARIPKLDEENRRMEEFSDNKLPISGIPVSTTIARVNGQVVVDPTRLEEEAMEARMTIGTFERDGIKIASMQKGGSGGFTPEEIDKAVEIAEEKGKELRKLVKSKTG